MPRCPADRPPHVGRDPGRGVSHLVAAYFERFRHPIELPGKADERAIAVPTHAIDDAMDAAVERRFAPAPARQ